MTIQQELAEELKEAIRSRDRDRADVIRQVTTEVSKAKAEPGFSGEVDDGLYRDIMTGYVKKMEKARREFEELGEAGAEHARKLAFEVEYLSRWLPKALGEEETRHLVRQAIDELDANDPKLAGRVVGHVMKSGQEDLDGRLVNQIVREELGEK